MDDHAGNGLWPYLGLMTVTKLGGRIRGAPMAKITIHHSKKFSELELQRAVRSLKSADSQENLQERVRQLQRFEKKFGMSSVSFYQKYRAGKMGDEVDVVRWAISYEAYLSLMQTSFLSRASAS
jgi:hypothetical protein